LTCGSNWGVLLDMANLDDDPIRRRMMSLSDEELRRVVTVEADDWQPEAIAIARQEMERRTITAAGPYRGPANQQSGPPAPIADRRRPDKRKGVPLILLMVLLLKVILILARY
jgi:hypothetical protein